MKTEKIKKDKTIVIDNSLEKYKSKTLFQDKLEKANNALKRIGLPKIDKK